MIIHILFEVQVPRVQGVDDVLLLGQLPVHSLQLAQLAGQIQILHEKVDLLSLAGEIYGVVFVPLSQVGFTWQEPDWVELLAKEHVAPD